MKRDHDQQPKRAGWEAARHERVRALLKRISKSSTRLDCRRDADPDAIIVTVGVGGYEPSEVKIPREL